MKISWLIILISFIGLTAFNLNDTFDGNNPSVKIDFESEQNSFSKGDIVRISIRLCSAENLESFSVEPDFLGNENSSLKYSFNNNTKQASINYFYTVPENIKNKKISFTFILKDNNNITEKTKSIKIN